jgi:hypothetical protein
MSDNTAILAGFTKEIMAYGGMCELHLFVRPHADLDGTFKAYDADECDWLAVNGWNFNIEIIVDHTISLTEYHFEKL